MIMAFWTFIAFLAVIVPFPAISQDQTPKLELIPNSRQVFLKDGSRFPMNCSVVGTDATKGYKLDWDLASPKSTAKNMQSTTVTNDDKLSLFSNIVIAEFSQNDVGTYSCFLGTPSGQKVTEVKIAIHRVVETKTEAEFDYDKKPKKASLSCNISLEGSSLTVKSMEWTKNFTQLSDLNEPDRFQEVPENNTLIIMGPKREDAGLFIASFEIEGSDTGYNCEVEYRAAPLVLDFDKSKNLIQEDNLELQCKVLGYPRAVVTWYKDGHVLNASQGVDRRIIMTPLNGYQNARLQVKSVEFDDAGDYKCEARSDLFVNDTSQKTITVRVKDKLAALWPFLAIVVEVLVLCTIIFIYEKRRNKQAAQEENIAQENDGASVDKKEGLRHRNTPTNNPTA